MIDDDDDDDDCGIWLFDEMKNVTTFIRER